MLPKSVEAVTMLRQPCGRAGEAGVGLRGVVQAFPRKAWAGKAERSAFDVHQEDEELVFKSLTELKSWCPGLSHGKGVVM